MPKTDTKGRPYAHMKDCVEGMILECDDGFSCMPAGARKVVHLDEDGLYIECNGGNHYLDGQLDRRGYLVGLYLLPQ